MLVWLRRLAARAASTRGRPPESSRPSSPSPGFLGERMYYVERGPFKMRHVEATCVDVSTDWVPLFDIKIKDTVEGRFTETIDGVRGYTALQELVQSRGWERRSSLESDLLDDAAAKESGERPE